MFTLTLLAEMSMSESVCNFPCWMCCFSLVEQRKSKFLRRGRNDTYVLLFFFTIMVAAARGAMMVHGLFVEFE